MGKKDKQPGIRVRLRGNPVIFILIVIVFLTAVSKNYLSFLDIQLFEERKSHIVEFTDKASEIVDSVIEYSWQQLAACEYIIQKEQMASKEEVLGMLSSMTDFMGEKNSLILAIDKNANYYCSDSKTGRWPQTGILAAKAEITQQFVAEIPHKSGRSYFMFLERLDPPVMAGEDGEEITHLALAVDMEVMSGKISVNGFGDQCYTYLVNQDGRRLYKHTYANNFIEGYNVLNSFEDYKILHGGTYEDFIRELRNGNHTALEFEFVDHDGFRRNWFVANASVASDQCEILLFVPTEVLGKNSALLLNRTIRFFAVASVIFFALVSMIIIVTMISKNDKMLVRQKDEANSLLKTAVEEANSANRAKSDFLSHMSHDIRTPINGIMGMTDIALKNIGNQEKVYDCLKKISGSSHHLLGLINDVLDMSRIESGKTKANHEKFNLKVCVENCVSIVGGQLTTRNLELLQESEEFEHPWLIGDELHLRQVFINILGNSVKFTPDGGTIRFWAKELEHTDKRALFRFELSDTGAGMKEEFLPHLFEAFSQEDGGTRTTYKGTGLGMAITKQFLDLLGAEVKVESKVDVGTKFTIDLWMDIDKDGAAVESSQAHAVNLKGLKVLLVEDIELNLEIVQSFLEDEGVATTSAMNGQEALELFATSPPGTFDAILMDIMMPVMDGITATKKIRALNKPEAKTIPIIAMTANAYEEDIKNTQNAGMNEHLSKPIDADALFQTLARYYPASNFEERVTSLSGLHILVADDVELNLEIARAALEEEGAVVTTAGNGREACNLVLEHPQDTFDLILMDVHMPVMDGIEASKAIRAAERSDIRKLPILAMTADVYEEDICATREAGMDGHLTKPLCVEKLKRLISECK